VVIEGGSVRNAGAGIGTPAQPLPRVPTALKRTVVTGREALGNVASVGGQLCHDGLAGRGDSDGWDAHALVAVVGAAHPPPLTLGIRHTLTNITSTEYVAEVGALQGRRVERSSWDKFIVTIVFI
jgi:hypothetical protein